MCVCMCMCMFVCVCVLARVRACVCAEMARHRKGGEVLTRVCARSHCSLQGLLHQGVPCLGKLPVFIRES